MKVHRLPDGQLVEQSPTSERAESLWSLLAADLKAAAKGNVVALGGKDFRRPGAEQIAIQLPGRYLAADGSELPCQTIDVSPAGLAIRGFKSVRTGEWVVAHIDDLGAIEGVVVQSAPVWFVVDVRGPARKLVKIARRLEWLIRLRDEAAEAEQRRHERIDQFGTLASVRTPDGRESLSEVIDLSMSGAALAINVQPPLGAPVTVEHRAGRVARHFPGGIAVEFEPDD